MSLPKKIEYQKMAHVEQKHWWYRSLHQLVLNHLEKNVIGKDKLIIDAGCGTGGLMLFLSRYGFKKVVGFDASPYAIAICHQRHLSAQIAELQNFDQHFEKNSTEVLISNDTFYFLKADEKLSFLNQCDSVLTDNGLLLLNLPALRAFEGIHDIAVGIKHRFNKIEMRDLFSRSAFKIQASLYWPFLLAPVIYLTRLYERRELRMHPNLVARSDNKLPLPALNRLLYSIVDFENRMLRKKPLGSSLFLVAKKDRKNADQHRDSRI